jgi:Ca2+-binding EF-hand superfamily protein
MDFSQLDKNGDKKITEDEAPERMKPMFGTLDTNHDGAIDAAEWAEMTKRFEAMRRQRSQEGAAPGAAGSGDQP